MRLKILVTGANGMIGSQLVKSLLSAGYDVVGVGRRGEDKHDGHYHYYSFDLSDEQKLERVIELEDVSQVIHLAALAHTAAEPDLSWEAYYQTNVINAVNVFKPAAERKIPILYISTADVYGVVDGIATAETELHPIGYYGRSKAMAEAELQGLCEERNSPFTIFRFAPVYTETVKRDIQKRYYLKYPKIAYLVGDGTDYEVLDIKNAVSAMVGWVENQPQVVWNIKNDTYLNTAECVRLERAEGRAKLVIRLPRGLVKFGFNIVRLIMGNSNPKVYLLNKVVHPLRTE